MNGWLSSANPSDLPSRDAVAEACRRFACEDKGDVAVTPEMLESLMAKTYNPVLGRAIAEAIRAESDLMSDITSRSMGLGLRGIDGRRLCLPLT